MESINKKPLIRLSKSSIGKYEKSTVLEVLDKEHLGMGEEVQKFERDLSNFFGRPCVCVTNGTEALQLAIEACNVGTEDEILVQSLTYVASFQAISATGAIPIPCEIDPKSMTLDLEDAEKRLTERTKAIMPIHYSGGVGALEKIYEFANANGLRVIEDAAHAFGTWYKGKKVGSFGDIACFSFDGIKNITSGEGGCIVTNNQEVLGNIRDARLLGVSNDTEKRFNGDRSWEFDVYRQGWRSHMSNIMAAIGLTQLKRFDEISKKRRKLAEYYVENLSNLDRISFIKHNYKSVVPHIFVIRINNLQNRQALRNRLLDAGIQTGIHYFPNHLLSFYRKFKAYDLPVTEAVYPELLTLPLHCDLNEENIKFICKELIVCLKQI